MSITAEIERHGYVGVGEEHESGKRICYYVDAALAVDQDEPPTQAQVVSFVIAGLIVERDKLLKEGK